MKAQRYPLEGKTLRRGRSYQPTALHNQEAWKAVDHLLGKPGVSNYDELRAAAYAANPKVGQRFIDYLFGNGWLVDEG